NILLRILARRYRSSVFVTS
ncbi:hypothetical protein CP8484711_1810, partial [Chlamydia psittaci 84-8471/1]